VRLFVAIVPPPDVLAELADAVAPLRTARPQLRWTGPDDWHLTLAFLGNVVEDVLPDLAIRTERAARRHTAQGSGRWLPRWPPPRAGPARRRPMRAGDTART
jgi:2'-5' RNA ligase